MRKVDMRGPKRDRWFCTVLYAVLVSDVLQVPIDDFVAQASGGCVTLFRDTCVFRPFGMRMRHVWPWEHSVAPRCRRTWQRWDLRLPVLRSCWLAAFFRKLPQLQWLPRCFDFEDQLFSTRFWQHCLHRSLLYRGMMSVVWMSLELNTVFLSDVRDQAVSSKSLTGQMSCHLHTDTETACNITCCIFRINTIL